LVIFGLLILQVLVPRQIAHISQSVNMEWGLKEKPCGWDCSSQMWKIRFSKIQTLETIENFAKFRISGN